MNENAAPPGLKMKQNLTGFKRNPVTMVPSDLGIGTGRTFKVGVRKNDNDGMSVTD